MGGGNHLSMKSLVRLVNEWEIQLLVLVSFTLQFFLLFAGRLRRRRILISALRLSIWLSYLGADLVAAYVLGLISRQEVSSRHLAFFWAPFLLIHLGGQDTITALAIEDNTLWRRHLLNLVVQMSLTLYIFWKSFDGGPNMKLLAPSILLFVTGTIKYGERTWALWCGSLRNIRGSVSDSGLSPPETSIIDTSSDPIFSALRSEKAMRYFFSGVRYPADAASRWHIDSLRPDLSTKLFGIIHIQLGLMFGDIYTKAMVLRTWSCTILRCISHVSFLAAFLLFFSVVGYKEERWYYSSVDTAITYGLFFGGFSLEVSSLFMTIGSPWTLAWLKENTRQCTFTIIRFIPGCRYTGKRCPRNLMGQYTMLNYLLQSDRQKSILMSVMRKSVHKYWGTKAPLWISRLVDTRFVMVDEQMMRCVVWKMEQYLRYDGSRSSPQQHWTNLHPVLEKIVQPQGPNFDHLSIIKLHLFTEIQLSRYVWNGTAVDNDAYLVRRISNYMVYLLVNRPELLPIYDSGESGRDSIAQLYESLAGRDVGATLRQTISYLTFNGIQNPMEEECTEAKVSELREAWVGVLLHAASKSRPEIHAALLAKGGELLTSIWLLMAHYQLGDVMDNPIEMSAANAPIAQRRYAF
uniref:Predicted protein n=1 Tax=Hordeum vulgare subsp. vulgare TaxID=112509 RepID=F2DBS1_HORVV|nr:predicted protein [Hordeum vulgare subsp. vulgare]